MISEPSLAIEQTAHQKRGLVVLRALYFLFFAGIATYFTFVNVYYSDYGLSGTQIGLLNMVASLVAILAATLWGLLNDRLGKPRLLLLMAAPGAAISALLIPRMQTYPSILIMACLLSASSSAIAPLMDNLTLRLLGERRALYGQYRVLGSIGYVITALSVGFLYQALGVRWVFPAYASLMFLFTLVSIVLPDVAIKLPGSLFGPLGQMIRRPAWLLFAISAFLLWLTNNSVYNYIGITIKEMGGAEGVIGLVNVASALAEIPILIYSERILRRFGQTRLIGMAFIIFAVRCALLASMPSPNWAPVISSLTGIAFGFFWISAVTYANEAAPEHLKSTAQGMLFSILNLGGMAGSLTGGWLLDAAGWRGLFWALSATCVIGLAIFITGRMRYRPS